MSGTSETSAPLTTSLWWDGERTNAPRPALATDETVDVCIVGAGYTGLWTAYYLLEADPSLSVLVLEAEHVGFGASGRNGGWVSALYPVGARSLARDHGVAAARDQFAALRESVDEIGRVCEAEAIDCGFHKGGTLVVARNRAQATRGQAQAQESDYWGTGAGTACEPTRASSCRPAPSSGPPKPGRPDCQVSGGRSRPSTRWSWRPHRYRSRPGARSAWPTRRPSANTGTQSSTASVRRTTGSSLAAGVRLITSVQASNPSSTQTPQSSPGSAAR